ncbi:MAG: HD domain-containing protein [bacterium]
MNKKEAINKTEIFVKETLANAEGGHDWWHINRVWKLARHIAKTEIVDEFIVDLGALLHDIAEQKFHDGNEEIGSKRAREFLELIGINEDVIFHIESIIKNVSYTKRLEQKFKSPELDVIQDADRLDALGAIGIARTFMYGGRKNRLIYDPNINPNLNRTKEDYKNDTTPVLNHFYEKLLLLKDKMNTNTGKKIAEHRHKYLEQYLDEFYKEWEGEL